VADVIGDYRPDFAETNDLRERVADRDARIARLEAALREIADVLDDLADADDGRPNNEMKMLVLVRAALNGEPQ
jgi:hypothetical protein